MAIATGAWTLEQLHRLPDDGNKYELLDGELFVTPAPNEQHETLAARLTRWLDPFVAAHGLGLVYHPRAVIRLGGSELEPDLMVRAERIRRARSWNDAPMPILVVEILSPFTRLRDAVQKREFYTRAGVEQYWIADGDRQSVRVVRVSGEDDLERERILWKPRGVDVALEIPLDELFAGVSASDE